MNTALHMQLVTLANGHRLLRLEDANSGLSLEKKLHPEKPLVAQKERLCQLFAAMLQDEMVPA